MAQRQVREEPIALLLENGAPKIAGIVGVLKSGKICVPLDPSYPEARATFVLEDAQAHLIVTDKKNLPMARQFAPHARQLINIDEMSSQPASENPELSILPETLAYILYTSGSTGRPKGVVQSHRNILHDIVGHTNGLHICADDRITLLGSCSGGQGMKTTFSALLNGATLYPFSIKEDGLTSLASWLMKEEITIYISAPTVFRHFIRTLGRKGRVSPASTDQVGERAGPQEGCGALQKTFFSALYFGELVVIH